MVEPGLSEKEKGKSLAEVAGGVRRELEGGIRILEEMSGSYLSKGKRTAGEMTGKISEMMSEVGNWWGETFKEAFSLTDKERESVEWLEKKGQVFKPISKVILITSMATGGGLGYVAEAALRPGSQGWQRVLAGVLGVAVGAIASIGIEGRLITDAKKSWEKIH